MDLTSVFLSVFPEADNLRLEAYLQFIAESPESLRPAYGETHHILPKSLFPVYRLKRGHPWNQKRLSAADHFVAHYLLWRVLPNNPALAYAWAQLRNCNKYGELSPVLLEQHAEQYELAKKAMAGERLTRKLSQATRKKMSDAAKIRVFSAEQRKTMSEAKLGHVHSEETKAKIRATNLGQKRTEEAKKRMSLAQQGKEVSEETRKKLSLAGRGRRHTEETKKKQADAHRGTPRSEETKRRISESRKALFLARRLQGK